MTSLSNEDAETDCVEMTYNEADTRANLIDPKLNIAGWTRTHVTPEHYYRPDFDGVTMAFVRFLK